MIRAVLMIALLLLAPGQGAFAALPPSVAAEVVDDGRTGILVPPSDPAALAKALNQLLDDPDLAVRMGAAGRERAVAEFSWRAIAQQTVALYELAIAGDPPVTRK